MNILNNLLAYLSTGSFYSYGLMVWSLLWLMPVGSLHIILLVLWELPYTLSNITSETFLNISLLIKILILAYPITTLSPWSIFKTTLGGLLLFISGIFVLNTVHNPIALKNILTDVNLTSKAYIVLLYLFLSNLLIPIVAKEDTDPIHYFYISLGLDEILTVSSRTYLHLSIPAIVSMIIGIATIIKNKLSSEVLENGKNG